VIFILTIHGDSRLKRTKVTLFTNKNHFVNTVGVVDTSVGRQTGAHAVVRLTWKEKVLCWRFSIFILEVWGFISWRVWGPTPYISQIMSCLFCPILGMPPVMDEGKFVKFTCDTYFSQICLGFRHCQFHLELFASLICRFPVHRYMWAHILSVSAS